MACRISHPIICATVAVIFSSGLGYFAKPALAFDDPAIADAQKLFKQYTDLERAYDPAQAELLSSTATVKDTRVYQDGPGKTLNWTGDNYKSIIKAQLPVEKSRGEQFVYSAVSFSKEGNNVRIKCTRNSTLKKNGGSFELLISPSGKNAWKIIEESFQTQP